MVCNGKTNRPSEKGQFGQVRDKSTTRLGLVGQYLAVLDLKMPCRLVCAVDQNILSGLGCVVTNEKALSWSHEQVSFPTRRLSNRSTTKNRLVCGKMMAR